MYALLRLQSLTSSIVLPPEPVKHFSIFIARFVSLIPASRNVIACRLQLPGVSPYALLDVKAVFRVQQFLFSSFPRLVSALGSFLEFAQPCAVVSLRVVAWLCAVA